MSLRHNKVETIEEFLERGGRIRRVSEVKQADSGKYGNSQWRYKMKDVRPEDQDVKRYFRKKK